MTGLYTVLAKTSDGPVSRGFVPLSGTVCFTNEAPKQFPHNFLLGRKKSKQTADSFFKKKHTMVAIVTAVCTLGHWACDYWDVNNELTSCQMCVSVS